MAFLGNSCSSFKLTKKIPLQYDTHSTIAQLQEHPSVSSTYLVFVFFPFLGSRITLFINKFANLSLTDIPFLFSMGYSQGRAGNIHVGLNLDQ